MASKIEFITIDEEYPVAGRDNDSQGLRDNFDAIKKSLGTAKEEMTDLQDNAARKDVDSEFGIGTTQSNLNLKNFTTKSVDRGVVPTPSSANGQNVEVDVSEGQFQEFVVANDIEMTFINWPAENYASIIVQLKPDYEDFTPPHSVTFRTDGENEVRKGPDAIWREPFNPIAVTARVGRDEIQLTEDSAEDIQVQLFEFWTYNGGEVVYARYIGSFDISSLPTVGGGQARIDFLKDIGDVFADNPNDGDTILWNAAEERWETGPGGEGGGAEEIVISSATGDFTLDIDDINNYIRVTSFGTVDVNVPTTPDIPIGSSVSFFQNGEGVVQIVPDEGVIVNSSSGFLTTRDQYSAMTLTKVGEDEWDLIGDLAAFVFVCGVSWLALGPDQFTPKEVLLGDTSPVQGTYSLFGINGTQMLHLDDPYGNTAKGDFSYVTQDNQLVAEFGANGTRHDLLFRVVDDSVPVNNFTLGSEFASDEAVIYFRPSFDSSSIPEATYTFKLVFRDPNAYATFGPAAQAASASLVITAEDYNANPDAVYAIPFPEPGAFNGITVETDGTLSGTILDFRLCLDQAQMVWPFDTLIPVGEMADDPIIVTNFTGEASTNTGFNLI